MPRWVVEWPPKGPMRVTREDREGRPTRGWDAEVFNLSDHIVCHRCHGWMNRLENRAIPIIRRLIQGQQHTFNDDDRKVVALWATKTAVLYRATQAKYRDERRAVVTIPRAWLDDFYRSIPSEGPPAPPLGVTVNLALNGGTERFWFIPRPFILTGRDIVGELQVDRLTLVLDALVLRIVMAFDIQRFYPYGLLADSPSRCLIHRIWPDTAPIAGGVSYPPPIPMSTDHVWAWATVSVDTGAL